MPNFTGILNADEVQAIKAIVIDRAHARVAQDE